jgi:hypothetical protein
MSPPVLITNDIEVVRGGPGSGHFGHAGRPGKKGGSAPSGRVGGGLRAPEDFQPIDGTHMSEAIDVLVAGENDFNKYVDQYAALEYAAKQQIEPTLDRVEAVSAEVAKSYQAMWENDQMGFATLLLDSGAFDTQLKADEIVEFLECIPKKLHPIIFQYIANYTTFVELYGDEHWSWDYYQNTKLGKRVLSGCNSWGHQDAGMTN